MTRHLWLAAAMTLLASSSHAAPEEFRTLTGAPAATGNPAGADGRIRAVTTPVLHLFRTDAAAPKGTVLLFPGGGYHVLSAVNEGSTTARFLNTQGYDTALLEYPIAAGPSTREFALAAALQAYRLIRAKPAALGLRPGRLGIMGYSAGGHLAARLASNLKPAEQPHDLILVYPAYLNETEPDSPTPKIGPPATKAGRLFVIIAANDKADWVKSSRTFANAWNAAKGLSEYHLLPDGGHGFGTANHRTGAAKDWLLLLEKFLGPQP